MYQFKSEVVRAVDLREKRRAAGMSVATLANVLGLADVQQVYAIERGHRGITFAKAHKAAQVLGPLVFESGNGRCTLLPGVDKQLGEQAATKIVKLRPGEQAHIAVIAA